MDISSWPIMNRLRLNWIICRFLWILRVPEQFTFFGLLKSPDAEDRLEAIRQINRFLLSISLSQIEVTFTAMCNAAPHDPKDPCFYDYLNEHLAWDHSTNEWLISFAATPEDPDGLTEQFIAYFKSQTP